MLSKEEIEKAKEKLNKFCEYDDNLFLQDEVLYEYQDAIEIYNQYIQELEEIKEMKEAIKLAGMKVDDFYKAIRTCHQLEQENKKLNKMIDEMAKVICMLDTFDNYDTWNNDINEVKQSFEKKVEEK